MQGRRTVQQNRMSLDDDLERVPDLGLRSLDRLTSRLDVLRDLGLDQTLHDERLEQLERHLLGQTALVHLQLRADDDNGTAGVVDTLTQQVLTETTLFTLEHIGQGFEGTVGGSRDGTAAATVVDQRVYRFLQHTFLVADDDIGRL